MVSTPFAPAAAFPYLPVVVGGLVLIGLIVGIFFWARQGSRRRVIAAAGCVVVALALICGLITAHAIAQQRKASAWKASLARLGFPLELPSVPGYYPMGAFTGQGSLEFDLGRTGPAPIKRSVLSVSLYRTRNSEGASLLSTCAQDASLHVNSQLNCHPDGAGRWMLTAAGLPFDEILFRKHDVIVLARAESADAHVPDSVVLQAVNSLRPATAAQIAPLLIANVG